ncbi:DUF5134 domain-containing protein, partial [Mycobacterium kiyosense]
MRTDSPAVFFLLAALWFVAVAITAVRSRYPRMANGYHALMM